MPVKPVLTRERMSVNGLQDYFTEAEITKFPCSVSVRVKKIRCHERTCV